MRILMTTDTVGGVWTFTQELASGLLARGCAICLVSVGPPPSDPQESWCNQMQARAQGSFRYEHIDAPLEWMSNNHDAYTAAAPSLLRLASNFGVDLLHISQFCFGALPLQIPKLITAHSDVLSWAQACRGGALQPSPWLAQYTSLVSRGLAAADSVIAPTRWMAHTLASTFSIPQLPSVIHNGRTLQSGDNRFRQLQAVTAGRLWDEAKNIALLADLRSPMPLLIAGPAEHDGAAMNYPLDNVTLVGNVASQDLLSLFRESAIYICTSRYEPFGLAPLEAALSGCAVLASDIPSLREVWGPAALYFQSADSLTSLLHRFHQNPRSLAHAQQQSAARARFFTAERMVDGYYRLFEQALVPREDAVHAA